MTDVDLILARPYRLSDRPIVRRTKPGGKGRKKMPIPPGFREDMRRGVTKAELGRKYGIVHKTTCRMYEEVLDEEEEKTE